MSHPPRLSEIAALFKRPSARSVRLASGGAAVTWIDAAGAHRWDPLLGARCTVAGEIADAREELVLLREDTFTFACLQGGRVVGRWEDALVSLEAAGWISVFDGGATRVLSPEGVEAARVDGAVDHWLFDARGIPRGWASFDGAAGRWLDLDGRVLAEWGAHDGFAAIGPCSDLGELCAISDRERETAALVQVDLTTGAERLVAQRPDRDVEEAVASPDGRPAWARGSGGGIWRGGEGLPAARDPTAAAGGAPRLRELGPRGALWLAGAQRSRGRWRWSSGAETHTVLDLAPHLEPSRLRDSGFNLAPQLEPARPREPVTYRARDGLEIAGFLTRPRGEPPSPLLLTPHGGPRDHDRGDFDPEAELFARQGWLVLSPDYRGSSGHGRSFRARAEGEWSGAMVDDLIDGARALIDRGLAAPGRAALVGRSYGGTAAVLALARAPELFRAAVAIAAIADLGSFAEFAAGHLMPGALETLRRSLGAAPLSPLEVAPSVTAPVLVAHGAFDDRVPLDGAERLARALPRGELMVLARSGHALEEADTVALYERVVAFLARHLGDHR